MGQEIVYCSGCQTRLTGRELESGTAFRAGNRFYCKSCFRALPPEERVAEASRPAQAAASAAPKARSPGTTRRIPTVSRNSTLGIGLAVGAGVLLGAILLAVVATGKGPPPPAPVPPPIVKKEPDPEEERRREAETFRRELEEKRREFARKEADQQKAAAELARLEADVRAACASGEFRKALDLIAPHQAAELLRPLVEREARKAIPGLVAQGRAARERVVAWGMASLVEEFDRALAEGLPEDALVAYQAGLAKGWKNLSWDSEVTMKSPLPGGGEGECISFATQKPYSGLYLRAPGTVDLAEFPYLTFRARATREGQRYTIVLYHFDDAGKRVAKLVGLEELGGQPTAEGWKRYVIHASKVHAGGRKTEGFALQDGTGKPQPPLYVKDVAFLKTEPK